MRYRVEVKRIVYVDVDDVSEIDEAVAFDSYDYESEEVESYTACEEGEENFTLYS